MKKIVIISLLFLYFNQAFSQDTIKTSPFYWELEFNYCNFTKVPANYSYNITNSFGGAFNLKYGFKLGKVISIVPGISFSMSTISSNLRFDNSSDITEIDILQDNAYYENSFSFNSISLPFLIQFSTAPNKKNTYFTFEIGYKFSALFSDKYSLSTKAGNIITTVSEISNKNINNFQHSILGQVNIRKYKICNNNKVGLSLFLHYEKSLSNLFIKNKGLDLGYNVFGFGTGLIFE